MRTSSPTGAREHPGTRTRNRSPNHRLRALLAESEWTQDAFARAIAVPGVEAGIRLRYDRASVAHWLRGSCPHPHIQALIAEALSRRLGRPVSVAELGMGGGSGPESAGVTPAYPGQHPADREEETHGEHSEPAGPGEREGREGREGHEGQGEAGEPEGHGEPGEQGEHRDQGTRELSGRRARRGPHRDSRRRPRRGRTASHGGPARPKEGTAPHSARGPAAGQPGDGAPEAGEADGTGRASGASEGSKESEEGSASSSAPAPVSRERPSAPELPHRHPADRLTELTTPVIAPPRADSPAPAPYRLNLLHGPTRELPRFPGHFPHTAAGGRPLTGAMAGDVASVREHARFFALQTDRHGGGHIRTPLAAYLSGLVGALRTGGDSARHRELLAGAARLSYLLARVYADEQRHGLAQRAFLTADELAGEAGDYEGVALIRRALSSQAHQLGHHRHSLALARAACAAAPSGTDPSTRAFLLAGLAVAEASRGARGEAREALQQAEFALARAPEDLTTGPQSPSGEPVGSYQDAALLYQTSQVRSALGDRAGAIRELRASVRSRPAGELRSRALSHATLAELLLSEGRLEEACSAWQLFLDDSARVSSGRAHRARSRIPALLRPYRRERCTQALLIRTSDMAGDGGFR